MLSARAQRRGRAWVLVIVLTGFALGLSAASTASAAQSEFYGISQGSLAEQDVQGMAAERRPARRPSSSRAARSGSSR